MYNILYVILNRLNIFFYIQISDKLEANDDIERDVEREIKETDELMYV